jgi:hypothetical protein
VPPRGMSTELRRFRQARLPASVTFLTSRARGVHTSVRPGRARTRVHDGPFAAEQHSDRQRYSPLTAGLGGGVGPRPLASRAARFSRRAGLRYFASLEAVCAIVGNPAERLKGIQATRRKADRSCGDAPATNADVNPSRARRQKRNTCFSTRAFVSGSTGLARRLPHFGNTSGS